MPNRITRIIYHAETKNIRVDRGEVLRRYHNPTHSTLQRLGSLTSKPVYTVEAYLSRYSQPSIFIRPNH